MNCLFTIVQLYGLPGHLGKQEYGGRGGEQISPVDHQDSQQGNNRQGQLKIHSI